MTFEFSKFKCHYELKPNKQAALLQPNKNKCVNIFADSEPCIKYGDFGT